MQIRVEIQTYLNIFFVYMFDINANYPRRKKNDRVDFVILYNETLLL